MDKSTPFTHPPDGAYGCSMCRDKDREIEALRANDRIRADEIKRLQARSDGLTAAVREIADLEAEIERLQKRNALLEDVAVAADAVLPIIDRDQVDVNRMRDALDKLQEAADGR